MSEPRTVAGRALLADLTMDYEANPGDLVMPAIREGLIAAILAIEAEAAARSPYEDPLGRVTFGPGCGPFNHPVGCRCPVPLTFEAEAAALAALDVALALETEWYNGNIDGPAYYRLCRRLGVEANPTGTRLTEADRD